jgi:hypothetical protein
VRSERREKGLERGGIGVRRDRSEKKRSER